MAKSYMVDGATFNEDTNVYGAACFMCGDMISLRGLLHEDWAMHTMLTTGWLIGVDGQFCPKCAQIIINNVADGQKGAPDGEGKTDSSE